MLYREGGGRKRRDSSVGGDDGGTASRRYTYVPLTASSDVMKSPRLFRAILRRTVAAGRLCGCCRSYSCPIKAKICLKQNKNDHLCVLIPLYL